MRDRGTDLASAVLLPKLEQRSRGWYEKYCKRFWDICCSLLFLLLFFWVYIVLAVLVRIKLGHPILFVQPRPGIVNVMTGQETIFTLYKFRSMSDARDAGGELLPDEIRLGRFGRWLRASSLDELPEIFNILKGDMSFIGPRPQLVRDMVFMTPEQRIRHTARPGLSGLAQINGRNSIAWEDKLLWDLKYIKKIRLSTDIRIFFATIQKAFVTQEGISAEDMATAEDFGDYLLRTGRIDQQVYDKRQELAKHILHIHAHM